VSVGSAPDACLFVDLFAVAPVAERPENDPRPDSSWTQAAASQQVTRPVGQFTMSLVGFAHLSPSLSQFNLRQISL